MAKTKSKLRQEQEAAMDKYDIRMPAALARYFRKIGGTVSEGARIAGEDHMRGFRERRHGAVDRRKRK